MESDAKRTVFSAAPGLTVVICLLISPPIAADDASEGIAFFETRVRPVLAESCFQCHGPKTQWAELRLDSRDGMLKGGESGPAIVPGAPDKSLLISALRHDGDFEMPPDGKLTSERIDAFVHWVKIGAPWPKEIASVQDDANDHWAFQPIVEPTVPIVADEHGQPINPIDAFIRSKLADSGLSPSPPADRRTLIRRVSYDLTGLPPAEQDVDDFVNDPDPAAYEKLVDRLLASPHYGEHWGRHWLDVARYSDSKGYVYAREERFWVHAWAYRDWVVGALNDDMPYDRFLLLQIAADQTADDRESLAAMGFLTLGRRFLGVTHDIIDDRIDVVTRGTMGLTVSCARCHDHKYDPIPTADYYSLYGVFQSCSERLVPLDPSAIDAAGDAFKSEWHQRRQKLETQLAARKAESSNRVRERIGDYLFAQTELHKYPEEGFDEILSADDLLPEFVRQWKAYLTEAKRDQEPVFAAWRAFAELDGDEFASQAEHVAARLQGRPASTLNPFVAQRFQEPPTSMEDVAKRYGELFQDVDKQWRASLENAKELELPPPTRLPHPAAEALRSVLYGPGSPCEIPDEPISRIERFFDSAAVTELWKLQGELDRLLIRTPQSPAHALILADADEPTEPRVFRRGNPATKGDVVPRQFLKLIAGDDREPFRIGSGRLELAEAIVSPDNPLTARVAVNRVWMHHFGAGLVRTPSDFGTRAEPPSHPDLLDWLASRFMASGWRLKPLHRLILLSNAYRQSSQGPEEPSMLAEAARQDPGNRLLWRMNVRRLSFEEMRDSLFAAAGTLDRSIGGKPADLFQSGFQRRTLYGLIDRQFLPSTLRIFDFANPDLHTPQRADTTVPQQALFFLNDRMLLDRAEELASATEETASDGERARLMFRRVFQREPTAAQLESALVLVNAVASDPSPPIPPTVADWSYGFGMYDESTQRLIGFQELPHFTGSSWQGGPAVPDKTLGWVHLNASGGHAGNDRNHAAVRRWTAPRKTIVDVRSTLIHPTDKGDGVRGMFVSSRYGLQKLAAVHNSQEPFCFARIPVEPGDVLDFVVDLGDGLSHDSFTWEVVISEHADASATEGKATGTAWDSVADFGGQPVEPIGPWQQLAQVLLSSNEFVFID